MLRRIIVLSAVIVVLVSGNAYGAGRKTQTSAKTYTARNIPHDPFLPVYANPQEVDISAGKKGKMHVSFKGVFRGVDASGMPNDWVYFAFTVKAEKDMFLSVSQSEMYDNKARSYKYYAVPEIAGERVFEREIIGGITVPVLVGVNMPHDDAGEYLSVSRMRITFNDESLEFRNISIEDWETWEDLKESLNL